MQKIFNSPRLIIWVEAPMTNIQAFICIGRLLKDIMNNGIPFGGKVIVLGEGFREVPHVVPSNYSIITLIFLHFGKFSFKLIAIIR